jgi:hypothetical protein
LFELYRFTRNPSQQFPVLVDYLEWWNRGQIFKVTGIPRKGKRLLVVGMSDHPFEVKWRAVVANILRRRGWDVWVLHSSRRQGRLRWYYRALGLEHFIAYDDVPVSPEELAEAGAEARLLLSQDLTFDAVRSWTFRGVWIGPQILSSASRRLLEGAPDPADPAVRRVIEALLPQMLRDVFRAERVVRRVRPDLGLLDEYHYSVAAPIVDAMINDGRSLATLRPMFRDDAMLPMRLTQATRRQHHASVSNETLQDLARLEWTEAHQRELDGEFAIRYGGAREAQKEYQAPDSRAVTRSELVSALGLDPSKKIAVIFSHVLWDANLFYGEDLFDNFGDWLVHAVREASTNDAVNWIVKLHPANLFKSLDHGSSRLNEVDLIQQHLGDLPSHVKLMYPDVPISTLSIYHLADYGTTVRGTPGLEMPCFGKPVLTAGTGRFEGLGFTTDSRTSHEYLGRLRSIQDLAPLNDREVQLARWHAYALFCRREWLMKSVERQSQHDARGWTPLSSNLRIRARSLAEVDRIGDLGSLGDWLEGDAVDYVRATSE